MYIFVHNKIKGFAVIYLLTRPAQIKGWCTVLTFVKKSLSSHCLHTVNQSQVGPPPLHVIDNDDCLRAVTVNIQVNSLTNTTNEILQNSK